MRRFASVPARRAAWRARWHGLPPPGRIAAVAGGVVLVLVLLGGFAFHDALGRWLWPDPRYDALRQRADVALRAGRLSAADGSGARELFEAALALQPDQLEAREGLARVAQAALARAEARAKAGDAVQAQHALQLARELQAPRARVDALEARLQAMRAQAIGIDALLARAAAAHAAGHLDDGADAALPLYQQVLQAQPRSQRALEGREDALEDLLKPAAGLLARGDLLRVAELVHRAEAFDPGHAALPALHAGLAKALEARGRQVRGLLARGRVEAAARACGELRLLQVEAMPDACARPLGDALLRAAGAAPPDRAGRLLALAREAGVDPARVQAAHRHLRQARRHEPPPAAVTDTPRVRARVALLLEQMERARARGDWLTPPGDSAWDRLREARALAPHDPRVTRAAASLLAAARACNVEALRDNNLGRARACLDAWRQLAPSDDGVAEARRRLAQRWIAIGSERLDAGQADDARRALEQARGLDSQAPGLGEFAERVGKAR
jgi:hypothetical protein